MQTEVGRMGNRQILEASGASKMNYTWAVGITAGVSVSVVLSAAIVALVVAIQRTKRNLRNPPHTDRQVQPLTQQHPAALFLRRARNSNRHVYRTMTCRTGRSPRTLPTMRLALSQHLTMCLAAVADPVSSPEIPTV